MEDAEPVAKHLVQSLHNLNGQVDFGQQIKHLLMFLDGFPDKMDVDFSLSTRSHTMQKYHVLIHHLQEYLIVGILLGFGKRLDEFEMRFSRRVQSAHLQFIGRENTPVDECLDHSSRTARLIHQFLFGHLLNTFPRSITFQTIPVGKSEESGQRFRLLQRPLHHTERHMQGLLVAITASQLHIKLHLRLEFLYRFHARWHSSTKHVT